MASRRLASVAALGALAWSGGTGALAAPVPTPPRPSTDPRSIESPVSPAMAPVPVARLFSIPGSLDAAVTPDGKDLVFTTDTSGRLNLWTAPVTGGAPRRLTTSEERHWGITVSPDSKTVVYTQDLGGAEMFDLHAVPLQGGTPRNLTGTPEASETSAVFSRDGGQLAFARRPKTGASADVFVLDLASGEERRLTDERLPDRQ